MNTERELDVSSERYLGKVKHKLDWFALDFQAKAKTECSNSILQNTQ